MFKRTKGLNLELFHLKNYPIKQKLLYTYAFLIVVTIVVVCSFAIYFSMKLYKEKAISYSLNMMKQISHNTDTKLTTLDKNSYIFLNDDKVKKFLTAEYTTTSSHYYKLRNDIQSFLSNFILTNQNVESVYLINDQGDIITTGKNWDISNPEYYHQEAATGDGSLVWLKTKNSSMGNRVIPVVRQVVDLASLKPNGTLLIHFRESAIRTLLDNHFLGEEGSIVVIDPEGSIVSSKNTDLFGSRIDPNVLQHINGREEYFFNEDELDNSFYTFYQSNYTNWTYLYKIPREYLFAGMDMARNWIIIVSFVLIIVSILTVRAIAQSISKPIHYVISEMENVEKNNLLVNLTYDGKDELHILTHTFNTMMNRIRNLVSKDYEMQKLKHELEMRALQAEINPHFLYNTLEAINWMGRLNNIPEISNMTQMLADTMRYSLDKKSSSVALIDELEHVKKYLGIQKIRYGEQLSVFIDIPEEMLDVNIPKLSLQPLVENAIVHGLENQPEKGRLRILGHKDGGSIKIIVEDNGCGISEEKIKSLYEKDVEGRKGIGFYNVHRRIQLLYGDSFGLDVFSIYQKGTRITIKLPFERGDE